MFSLIRRWGVEGQKPDARFIHHPQGGKWLQLLGKVREERDGETDGWRERDGRKDERQNKCLVWHFETFCLFLLLLIRISSSADKGEKEAEKQGHFQDVPKLLNNCLQEIGLDPELNLEEPWWLEIFKEIKHNGLWLKLIYTELRVHFSISEK